GQPLGSLPRDEMIRAPGMYRRHYAPKARLELVRELKPSDVGLTFGEPAGQGQIRMPLDPRAYAANLYVALHRLDALKPSVIRVEEPADDPAWEAIIDRLRKASADAA
ncbi:MAG TPA: Sua5 family C-terminal domain-containing protein, partial [Fimbriimonadaceae bacterium]|nr:Sua5 family C-terminal domain-containing protein [Fimbriimonadaceae bacterium]